MNIINLHCYTANGSLESIIRNEQLINLKHPWVSVIDPYMFNVVDFLRDCDRSGKIPVIGLDSYVAFGKVDQLKISYGQIFGRYSLIAYNSIGYYNLVRLMTFGYISGLYSKPRIDFDVLSIYNEGILCLINSAHSTISYHLNNQQNNLAIQEILLLKEIFGDRLYLEIIHNYHINNELINLCNRMEIKIIISNIVCYLNREDSELFRYLWAINNNQLVSDTPRLDGYHYKDTIELSKGIDDCYFDNLFDLLNRIENYGFGKGENHIPSCGINKSEFIPMMFDALDKKGLNSSQYIDRLNHELSVIQGFGYEDYFLLIKDLINYCNNNLSGYYSAGRGSVGGCLVAYLLGITRIDPVNPQGFNMSIPFDRFLNSGRKVMPDIDLDFLPKDRSDIIEYLMTKYGTDCVKNMTTITTLGARSALREVCRITGWLNPKMEAIIKSFPTDQHLTLSIVRDSDIYKQNKDDDVFIKLFNIAEQLEGIPKSVGIHASGIALSSIDMDGNVPLFVHNSGKIATQYNQDQLEYIGIMKLDILGLNTLQILNDTLDFLYPSFSTNDKINHLNSIITDDKEVFDFICNGSIPGVFQWDTHNYKKVIKHMQPSSFKELVDLNTLGRSAALISGLTDKYIRRKYRTEEIEPLHSALEGLMSETYCLPLYQEQIMELFVKLADYSLSEADDVRKAIGKKLPELMMEQKDKFINRCSGGGDVANEIWDIIEKFSKYTWNLGHALTYTRLCYETAYFAYHHPEAYYCACINHAGDAKEAGHFLSTLKNRGIDILPLSINKSDIQYKPAGHRKIQSGFAGLKYISEKTAIELIKIRNDGFKSLNDFNLRVPKKLINKTACISLYVSGAFDELITTSDDINILCSRIDINDINSLIIDQYNKCGRLTHDPRNYVSGNFQLVKDLMHEMQVFALIYVVSIREIFTKKGNKMAFVEVEDISGRHDIVIFPDVWERSKITIGNLYCFQLSFNNGIICNAVIDVMSDIRTSGKNDEE